MGSPPDHRPIRVLVVEDNPIIRSLVDRAIRRMSSVWPGSTVEITQAEDGASALAQIETSTFDLLVVDLYIPVLPGIELIRRLRENNNYENLKIMAMSASYIDAESRALDAGADVFVQKPLKLNTLLESLEGLLHSQSLSA